MNSDFGGVIFTSPGIECVIPETNNIISNSKKENLVPNCEYYYNISKLEALFRYGCLKCKFGFTGITVGSDNKDLYPGIDECVSMNDPIMKPAHGLDGDCDLSVFY